MYPVVFGVNKKVLLTYFLLNEIVNYKTKKNLKICSFNLLINERRNKNPKRNYKKMKKERKKTYAVKVFSWSNLSKIKILNFSFIFSLPEII